MAQTGYVPISLYYSTTAATAPTAANLVSGELAINITDGILFYKDNAGVVQTLASKAAASGSYTSITLTGGTANGVAYLNGSKVLTTGSALTFDGTNLGVGGAAFNYAANAYNLQVSGTGYGILTLGASSNATDEKYWRFINRSIPAGVFQLQTIDDAAASEQIAYEVSRSTTSLAYHRWFAGTSEQMRLTSTGLGIGTSSPGAKLDVAGSAFASFLKVSGGSGAATSAGLLDFDSGYTRIISAGASAGAYGGFRVYRANAGIADAQLSLDLDSSGNLGLGVTPSTVNNIAGYKSFEIGQLGNSIYAGNNQTLIGTNVKWDGGTPKYAQAASNYLASIYNQQDGQHQWYTAPSGTAGTTISFTQAMTLDASGNLGVGTTSPGQLIDASKSQNADTVIRLTNANTGSAATAQFFASNGISQTQFFHTGTSYSTAGAIEASQGGIYNTTTQGIVLVAAGASGILRFATGGTTERARIDSSGNLLVGTTSAVSKLTVAENSYDSSLALISAAEPTRYGAQIQNLTSGGNTNLVFLINQNNGGYTERARITSSGVFDIGTGSGAVGQIQFPATQVPSSNANTLDDYEEGSFTLTLADSAGNSATMGGNNVWRYVKIGRTVTIAGTLDWTSTSALSAGSRITLQGLPFTADGSNANIRTACTVGSSASGSCNIPTAQVKFGIDGGNTFIWGTNATGNNVDNIMVKADLGNSGTIYGMVCTYLASA